MAGVFVTRTIIDVFQNDKAERDRLLAYLTRTPISFVLMEQLIRLNEGNEEKIREHLSSLGKGSFVFLLDTLFGTTHYPPLRKSLERLDKEHRVMAMNILASKRDKQTMIKDLEELVAFLESSLTWSNSPFGFVSAFLFGSTSMY
eukprot:TRINITY_DN3058_c0_g1_i1.p1 TRINITY_DN3058_c0_g1~~TRINITY_DN3058_c0_g1_i1.p1  ORF type:complete len:145 (-),score=23.19 TRINITY_DN3058_c0_g1_i1:273-707(-)